MNIDKVKTAWLDWQDQERRKIWLPDYTYNELLNKSAWDWSKTAKQRGKIDHKRNKKDRYYDFKKIGNWLKWEWVVCKNVSKKTFSESIGYGVFTCKDWECSDELTEALKGTFKLYMSEKWKKSTPHYGAIVNKYFTLIWTGIEVDKTWKNRYKYYITTHYCTELIPNK